MIRLTLVLAVVTMFAGQSNAQTTGTIVVYRELGSIHYAGGVHPTVYCDDVRVAKLRENHKVVISTVVGQHTCVAIERQADWNEGSEKVSVDVKPNLTTYLRLHIRFGHSHFVLQQVPEEIGSAETAKAQAAKKGDSYTTVLPVTADKKPSE